MVGFFSLVTRKHQIYIQRCCILFISGHLYTEQTPEHFKHSTLPLEQNEEVAIRTDDSCCSFIPQRGGRDLKVTYTCIARKELTMHLSNGKSVSRGKRGSKTFTL